VEIAVEEDEEDGLEPASAAAAPEVPPLDRAVAILTNPRTIVGGIFVLLLIALALIFAGVGPV
jgi:hypothetical protein